MVELFFSKFSYLECKMNELKECQIKNCLYEKNFEYQIKLHNTYSTFIKDSLIMGTI